MLLILMVVGLASCTDDAQEVFDESAADITMNGGGDGEDDDDPIPPGCGC